MPAPGSALDAVSVAVRSALIASADVTAAAPGGVSDDVPQNPTFPFLLYEVSERFDGSIGTKPGSGAQYEIALTLHAYAQAAASGGMKLCELLISAAILALKDPISVIGFSNWAHFHDETIPVGDELVAGIKVKEVVGKMRLEVELA